MGIVVALLVTEMFNTSDGVSIGMLAGSNATSVEELMASSDGVVNAEDGVVSAEDDASVEALEHTASAIVDELASASPDGFCIETTTWSADAGVEEEASANGA